VPIDGPTAASMSDSTIVPTKAEKLLKPMARRVAISQARLFVSSHLLPLGVLCSMLCPSHIFVAVVGEQKPERCIGDYARQRGAFAVVEIIV